MIGKLTRRTLLATTAALLVANKAQGYFPHGHSINSSWSKVTNNGGGTLPGLSFSNDGSKAVRTDTAGWYVWDSVNSTWVQSAAYLNIPNGLFEASGYRGLLGPGDIQFAPSNSNYLYGFAEDAYANNRAGASFLVKSTNKGNLFSVTNYPENWVLDTSSNPMFGGSSDIFKRVRNKIGVDPANPNTVYAANPGGFPLVTHDGGATWDQVPNLPTGSTTTHASASSSIRTGGSGGTNGTSQTVTAIGGTGTIAAQFNVTISGGAITAIHSVTTAGAYSNVPPNPVTVTDGAGLTGATIDIGFICPTVGACCWTFDPTGGTTGGRTNNIYVAVAGSGVWFSSDAGVSFTQLSSTIGVTSPGNASISADGNVFYICDCIGGTQTLSAWTWSAKYSAGAWTTLDTNGANSICKIYVAAHPVTAGIVYTNFSSGSAKFVSYSNNYGASWTRYSYASTTFNSSDAPWLPNQMAASGSFSSNCLLFDPANPNDLYLCLGQGIWKSTTTAGVQPIWSTITTGIEQVVVNDMSIESGTPLFQTCADLVCFKHPTNALSTAPSNTIWGAFTLDAGTSFAIDPANVNNMVIAAGSASHCGYSNDAGATWHAFATTPTLGGAFQQIMINNGVILWSMGIALSVWYRSADWGATWTTIAITGTTVPSSPMTGWNTQLFNTRHTGCADRVDPNTFYIYNYLSGQSPDCRGTYISIDAGVTFAYQGSSTSDPYHSNSGYSIQFMKGVPGVQSALFATAGYNSATPSYNHPISEGFYKSTNGGSSWSAVANVLEVNAFAFGKAGPSGNPTLFIAGFYKNIYGIFMSQDLGGSFTQMLSANFGPWPLTNDAVTCMDADKDVFGKVYVGFRGSGSAYCVAA